MGIAGDMFMSALFDVFENKSEVLHELNAINIPDTEYIYKKDIKNGIAGSHIIVKCKNEIEGIHEEHHHYHHNTPQSIFNTINSLNLEENIKNQIKDIFKLIADAESRVHGVSVTDIHFHEVGTMDAIADIAGCCFLLEKLGIEKVIFSPVNTGSGSVKCSHGILPIPAPATADILKGIPVFKGSIEGELTTPTGAALVKYFGKDFYDSSTFSYRCIGIGTGTKDFEEANILRIFLCDENKLENTDTICELKCNIDDMTAEEIAFACENILNDGARDVFTVPVNMKKGRPAVCLVVLCNMEDRENIVRSIFKNTETLGIRETIQKRYVLDRNKKTFNSEFGDVEVKYSKGYGSKHFKPEFRDISKIANEKDMSFREVSEKIKSEILKKEENIK